MEQYNEQLARQVWQRVHAGGDGLDAAAPLALAVSARYAQADEARTMDCILARRLGGCPCRMLHTLAAQRRDQMHALEAVYYVLTGRLPKIETRRAAAPVDRPAVLLRGQVRQAQASRAAYLELAETAPEYAQLFSEQAALEQRHAQQLLTLLQHQLCGRDQGS